MSSKWIGQESNQLTLFQQDSPASPPATQDCGSENETRDGSGQKSSDASNQRSHDGSCSKTSQPSVGGEDLQSCEALTHSGMMHGGLLFRLQPLERRTFVPEFLSSRPWPTPTASPMRPCEGNVRAYREKILAGEMTHREARMMLNGGKSPFEAQGKVPKMWATPTARDHRSGKVSHETFVKNSRPLNEQVWFCESSGGALDEVSGHLCPAFVEHLMGFPQDWTKID